MFCFKYPICQFDHFFLFLLFFFSPQILSLYVRLSLSPVLPLSLSSLFSNALPLSPSTSIDDLQDGGSSLAKSRGGEASFAARHRGAVTKKLPWLSRRISGTTSKVASLLNMVTPATISWDFRWEERDKESR